MKTYYYDSHTKHLYSDKFNEHPFLCPVEATPKTFDTLTECIEFLDSQDIVGVVETHVLSSRYSKYFM